jgi:AcrR family transcriptional regulator
VLVTKGLESFTIAAVAEQAGVSVGGVYRRFANKEQLIDAVVDSLLLRMQETVAASLGTADASLIGVVSAFAHALADYLAHSGRVASALVAAPRPLEPRHQGLQTLTILQRLFLDAAAPYGDQIARTARSSALTTVLRTVLGAGAHRQAVIEWWPDGMSWTDWADEITGMAMTYLITPENAASGSQSTHRRRAARGPSPD